MQYLNNLYYTARHSKSFLPNEMISLDPIYKTIMILTWSQGTKTLKHNTKTTNNLLTGKNSK